MAACGVGIENVEHYHLMACPNYVYERRAIIQKSPEGRVKERTIISAIRDLRPGRLNCSFLDSMIPDSKIPQ